MKRIAVFITLITAMLILALSGCGSAQTTLPPTASGTTTPTKPAGPTVSTTPVVVTPIAATPSSTPAINESEEDKMVLDFVKNSATFKFDGVQNSLAFTKSEYSPISSFRSIDYEVTFQTTHPGHGDRSGVMLAQVMTEHTARVYFDRDAMVIRIAVCDGTWDLIKDRALPKSISGIVIGGGDTALEDGPLDVPHTFVYQVKQEDGSLINVSYQAYPPSPAGDLKNAKISLTFYGDGVQTGDYIKACGTYDLASNSLIVAAEGDFLKTYPEKPSDEK